MPAPGLIDADLGSGVIKQRLARKGQGKSGGFRSIVLFRWGEKMNKQYRSEALAAVHETALGLHEAGAMDKQTLKVFDEMCLTPVEQLTPDQIRQIRLRERASQAVFARYLNVTTGLVSQWERGQKHPRGASLKLLTLVAKKGLQAVA